MSQSEYWVDITSGSKFDSIIREAVRQTATAGRMAGNAVDEESISELWTSFIRSNVEVQGVKPTSTTKKWKFRIWEPRCRDLQNRTVNTIQQVCASVAPTAFTPRERSHACMTHGTRRS